MVIHLNHNNLNVYYTAQVQIDKYFLKIGEGWNTKMAIKSFPNIGNKIQKLISEGKTYSMDPQGNWYYTGIA